jgi:hypothetical protein
MRKTIILLAMVLCFVLPKTVFAASSSEIIQRVDADVQASNHFFERVEAVNSDSQAILDVIQAEGPALRNQYDTSSLYYGNLIISESDTDLREILQNLKDSIDGLSGSLARIEMAIEQEDVDEYESALESYDAYLAQMNTAIDAMNNHFGVADYSWLAWPFWFALPISAVLFIKSRGNPILPADQLRKQFEFALFKSSLWPTIGSAVSYFWYLATPPGGTFYILYGPIFVGYFQFLRGLYSYVTTARPAINLAKKEERAKLEELIRSEKFNKESAAEKLREIEEKRGTV